MKRSILIGLVLLTVGISAGLIVGVDDSTNTPTTASSSSTTTSIPAAKIVTAVSNTSGDTSTATAQTAAAISEVTSNWAGYEASSGTYTAVSGSWTVPSVTVSDASLAADATWIGIGGTTSDDLIQVGTQSIVENGQVEQSAFYEELPNSSIAVPTLTVRAGDTIHGSITETSSGEWTINLEDETTGQSFSQTVAYDSSESSAEWIEEAPSDQAGVMSLDEFGSVTFSNANATENGQVITLASNNATTIGLINENKEALANVSTIANGSFIITRTSASSVDNTAGEDREPEVDHKGFKPGGAAYRDYSDYYYQ